MTSAPVDRVSGGVLLSPFCPFAPALILPLYYTTPSLPSRKRQEMIRFRFNAACLAEFLVDMPTCSILTGGFSQGYACVLEFVYLSDPKIFQMSIVRRPLVRSSWKGGGGKWGGGGRRVNDRSFFQ